MLLTQTASASVVAEASVIDAGNAAGERFISVQLSDPAPRLLDLAKAVCARAGFMGDDSTIARMLQLNDRFRRSVTLFATAGTHDAAAAALDHFVVNEIGAIEGNCSDAFEARVSRYAKFCGWSGAELTDTGILVTMGPKKELVPFDRAELGSGNAEDLLRAVCHALNDRRFGSITMVPPLMPLSAASGSYDDAEALNAYHLSHLNYVHPDMLKAQLEAWGTFEMSTLRTFHNAETDTPGFMILSKQNRIWAGVRGTASGTNVRIDLSAAPRAFPELFPDENVKLHDGFGRSCAGLRRQFISSYEELQRAAGGTAGFSGFGHSLGAAITHILTASAVHAGLLQGHSTRINNLGSPRCGNQAFATLSDNCMPELYRLVRVLPDGTRDLVTKVGPKAFPFGYRHAGNCVLVKDDGVEIIRPGAETRSLFAGMLEALSTSRAPAAMNAADPDDDAFEQKLLSALRNGHTSVGADLLQQLNAGAAAVIDQVRGTSGPVLESMSRSARAAPQAIMGDLLTPDTVKAHLLKSYGSPLADDANRSLSRARPG